MSEAQTARKRLASMPSADLESEPQWIEAELEHLGILALEGEPVGIVVGQYQSDMDAIMGEIKRRKRANTLPRGGTRPTFDRAFVQRVKDATDMVDLVQASGVTLKKAGKAWRGLSPFTMKRRLPYLSVVTRASGTVSGACKGEMSSSGSRRSMASIFARR